MTTEQENQLKRLYGLKGELVTEIELMQNKLQAVNREIVLARSTPPPVNKEVESQTTKRGKGGDA